MSSRMLTRTGWSMAWRDFLSSANPAEALIQKVAQKCFALHPSSF